jgi:hypothetical protein
MKQLNNQSEKISNIESKISIFINQSLPELLLQNNFDEISDFVSELGLENISEDQYTNKLLSQCTFLEAAFYGNKNEIPTSLLNFTSKIADHFDKPPTLTFQQIILENTQSDLLFTKGQTRKSESQFYEANRTADLKLKPILDLISILCQTREFDEINLTKIIGLSLGFDGAIKKLLELKNITVEDFTIIRKYFTKHPIHNLAGAGGIYCVGFPAIDYLLQSEDPTKNIPPNLNFELFAKSNKPEIYCTINDFNKAIEQRNSAGTVFDLLNKTEDNILKDSYIRIFKKILHQLLKFRKVHKDVIFTLIPEMQAMRTKVNPQQEVLGTSGIKNPIQYMDSVNTVNQNSIKLN